MREFFEVAAQIAVLVFVVTCMATAGLGLGVRDILEALRRKRLVVAALALNFLIAPTVAYGMAKAFALDPPYTTGLILLGVAAGAPFLPKLAQLAKGDVAFSVGLMLLFTIGTVVLLPVLLRVLIPGQSADPWAILRPLLFTMLVPLCIGVGIRARSPRLADRLGRVFGILSNISMALAVVLLIGLHVEAMIATFGSGAVLAAVLFLSLLVVCGYLLGGPAMETRSVLALGTGQRNIAAALIVATQVSDDPAVTIMLIASTLAGLIVLVPAAFWFARRSTAKRTGRASMIGAAHEEVLQ